MNYKRIGWWRKLEKNRLEKIKLYNKGIYYSFTSRLIFEVILFVLFLIIGIILLNNSFVFNSKEVIKYNESSDLDYKVYVHNNEFYDQPYLEKDMLYVASLIDKISIDFNYIFKTDNNETIDFNYSVIGKLSITNESGSKTYFEKTYTLLDNKKMKMNDTDLAKINEIIDIDYSDYNNIANWFKTSYGVETESNLTVYMVINKKSNGVSDFEFDDSSYMSVTIPLSEKSVDIKLDYQDINELNRIIKEGNFSIKNFVFLILSIILIVISIIVMIKIIKKISLLRTKKSKYDKYIEKLLKEYDRLIVETSSLISFDDKDVIRINKFTELLDIHDNLQQPIMYYTINKHLKSYFYIKYQNTIYLMVVKAVDLEASDEKK